MKSEIQTEAAFYLHRYFYNKGNEILSVVSLPQNDPSSPAVAGYAEVNKPALYKFYYQAYPISNLNAGANPS